MRLARLTALTIPGLVILAACVDTPSAEAVTDPAHKGPSCALPTLNWVGLPTLTLTTGQNITHRLEIAAPTQNDILVKRLTHNVSTNKASLVFRAAEIREVGAAAPLAWTVAETLERGGTSCGYAATAFDRCTAIELAKPLVIPASSKRYVDLRLTVSGSLAVGDYLSTMLETDPNQPPVSGNLVPGVLGHTVAGVHAPFIWSCDGSVWHNDAGIPGPGAVTLTYN